MKRREQVRSIVARVLADGGDLEPFADGDSLVVSGRISSLDVVNIVTGLEEACGFELDADEFDPSYFDSVDSIVELLGRVAPG